VTPPEEFTDALIHENGQNLNGEEFNWKIKERTKYNESERSRIVRNKPKNNKHNKASLTPAKIPPYIPMSPIFVSAADLATSNFDYQTSLDPFNSQQTYFSSYGSNSILPNMIHSSAYSRSSNKKQKDIEKSSSTAYEPVLLDTTIQQTRKDFIQDILNVGGTAIDESMEVVSDEEKKIRKNKISRLDKITQELYLALLTKVEAMREEESCLELEYEENELECNKLEDRFREVAEGSKVEKFLIHWSEIKKIVALILSLTGRLVKVVNILDNMEWNGVDEREDLQRKRDKLEDQLKEAQLIWYKIDKRTETVSGYIEQCLTRLDKLRFMRMIKRKVRLMMEMKEMQEKLELAEKQLKAINCL
jgi:hypothetical protein